MTQTQVGDKLNAKSLEAIASYAQSVVYYHKAEDVAARVDAIEHLAGLLIPSNMPDPPLPSSCARLGPVL